MDCVHVPLATPSLDHVPELMVVAWMTGRKRILPFIALVMSEQ